MWSCLDGYTTTTQVCQEIDDVHLYNWRYIRTGLHDFSGGSHGLPVVEELMVIKTIGDLRAASANEIKEAMKYVSIVEDLEDYLAWLYDSETTTEVSTKLKRYKTRSLGVHPSSACKENVCLLKIYYECTGKMERMRAYDSTSQKTWDIGTMLHDTYQTHFRNMWPDQFRAEVGLEIPELMIKSHTDGIFDFTQARAVLEMKSIKEGGSFGWEKIQLKPMVDNLRQTHFYMAAADVPFGIILYLNKNAGKVKEHVVAFDQSIWEDIQENVVIPVVKAVQNGGGPPLATAGYHCRWCDFNHSCPTARKESTNAKRPPRRWR